MDILCLTGFFPDNYRHEIERDSIWGMQNAADKLQRAIVKGLADAKDVRVSVVNSLYIGSYPRKYRRMRIPTFDFVCSNGVKGMNVGFNNLMAYKWFSRYFSARKAVEKWAQSDIGDKKVLLIYAMTTPFMQIAEYIGKKYKNIHICVIVPDLPEYMNTAAMGKVTLYRLAKQTEIRIIRRSIRYVDSYVLLTDAMKEWFGYPVKYTVVEGIASEPEGESVPVEKKKEILYAGGVKYEYGVADLVKAFREINDPDWNLVIYGDGADIEAIRKIASGYPNIKMMGARPNKEVVAEQRRASVLVNPRKNQIFTRYSFPSKILEYMASGTPILAYKLDGVPAEYDTYYYHINENEITLKEAMEKVIRLPEVERERMGRLAREFVLEKKNNRIQAAKIVSFLENEMCCREDRVKTGK